MPNRVLLMRRWGLRFGALLFAIAILNFLVYQSICLAIHGSAANGKIVDGGYYVNYKGEYTEVSRDTYQYSYYHDIANNFTFGLGILGLLFVLPSNITLKAAAERCKRDKLV